MNEIKLILGDCTSEIIKFDAESVNLIYADPPYNLSGDKSMTVKSGKPVKCDKGEWDKIGDIYEFNKRWIKECIRVLKPNGTMWISGTLHNYPSINLILKEFGMWIINDVVWYKPNATPLLSQNRFAPSTELIWVASKSKKYYFDYKIAKEINGGRQMRNLWILNSERHKTKHPTEKPEKLLERIVLIGSEKEDVVLDPFMGSGTTGVVANRHNRSFIGIEIDEEYYSISKRRIENAVAAEEELKMQTTLTSSF